MAEVARLQPRGRLLVHLEDLAGEADGIYRDGGLSGSIGLDCDRIGDAANASTTRSRAKSRTRSTSSRTANGSPMLSARGELSRKAHTMTGGRDHDARPVRVPATVGSDAGCRAPQHARYPSERMKLGVRIPIALVVVFAMLVLVALEASGIDVPDWLLYVAFGAGAGLYLVRSNRAPQLH